MGRMQLAIFLAFPLKLWLRYDSIVVFNDNSISPVVIIRMCDVQALELSKAINKT